MPRRPKQSADPLRGAVDRALAAPLFRQIYLRVLEAMSSGALGAGASLPSARTLASGIGVARGTIEEAYGLLATEGYIVRRGPAGSMISPQLSQMSIPAVTPTKPPPAQVAATSNSAAPSPFRMGLPALDAFPRKLWSRLAARVARQPLDAAMDYPDPCGHPALRHAIAQYLALSRGIRCAPAQIVMTGGYQGAIDLIARVALRPGDSVWFEDPGYMFARSALISAGAHIVPIPIDQQGMRVDFGVQRAPAARLAVTTPAHQSPLCVTMSLSRRLALLSWAADHAAWIVEDDYDGEFHYGERPLPALKSLDRGDRVIYAGSFSKTVFPGLRLGYMVVPVASLRVFTAAARVRDAGPPVFGQAVTAAFLDEGHFVRHLHRMRRLYAERRAALASALRDRFGERLSIALEGGGMHLVAGLRSGVRDKDVAECAAAGGLAVHTLSGHCIGRNHRNGLLLGFTNVPAERAPSLARKLHRIIAKTL